MEEFVNISEICKKRGGWVAEDRRQKTENSNVARMKPAEYGNCTQLSSVPVFVPQHYAKIYKKQGGWVAKDRGQNTDDGACSQR